MKYLFAISVFSAVLMKLRSGDTEKDKINFTSSLGSHSALLHTFKGLLLLSTFKCIDF